MARTRTVVDMAMMLHVGREQVDPLPDMYCLPDHDSRPTRHLSEPGQPAFEQNSEKSTKNVLACARQPVYISNQRVR